MLSRQLDTMIWNLTICIKHKFEKHGYVGSN